MCIASKTIDAKETVQEIIIITKSQKKKQKQQQQQHKTNKQTKKVNYI